MTIKVADATMTEAAQIFRCARSTIYKRLQRNDPALLAWIAERQARLAAEESLRQAMTRIELARRYL